MPEKSTMLEALSVWWNSKRLALKAYLFPMLVSVDVKSKKKVSPTRIKRLKKKPVQNRRYDYPTKWE